MRRDVSSPQARSVMVLAWFVSALAVGPRSVAAHENHAPLPTKGVKIVGDQIMISAKGREAIGMTTAKIGLGKLSRKISAHAQVELPWDQQAMITSVLAGKIEQVLVRPGEAVTAGQELARVVSMDLESLQLEMLQAATELALAKRFVTQRTTLDQQGVIAGKTLLDAKTTLAQKTAQLEIVQQKLRSLGLTDDTLEQVRSSGQPVGYLSITSPIAGTITHGDVRIGQVIRPTDHLYHVVDLSKVWIVGRVLEADVAQLRKDQEVKVSFGPLSSKTLLGRIDHLRLRLDPQSRTQAAIIKVDNPGGLLKPGMFGRLEIEVHGIPDAVVCPTDALIETRHGTYVLVQRGEGKYASQYVKLGLKDGNRVEILDGLFPGDMVVIVGNYLLASLLGNEHKTRVNASSGSGQPVDVSADANEACLLITQATVELPTDRQSFATSRTQGRITRILVQPSAQVRAGQVLAEVDSLELRNLQLDLLQAATRMRWIKQSLDRLEPLIASGSTSKTHIWQLQNDWEVLKQQASSLGRKLNFLGLTAEQVRQLAATDLTVADAASAMVTTVPVRAPIDGWLVGFDVIPGQVVQPQDTLFEIHDFSKVWARGYVFERDIERIALGQAARVTFAAYPDLTVAGSVVRISPTLESTERVLPVWVELENPDLRLKQGMFARVAVSTAASPDTRTARRSQDHAAPQPAKNNHSAK